MCATKNQPLPAYNFLIRERTVLGVLVLYAITLFLNGFATLRQISLTHGHFFYWIEYACIIYFIIEAILKIKLHGFGPYLKIGWNKLDLLVVIVSLPSLLEPIDAMSGFQAVLVLRLARLIRLFKLLRFIPNGTRIWAGLKRSLRASVGVFMILLLLNGLLAMGASILFSQYAPEHFENPLISMYSLFKVFTVEGWHDIPDRISEAGVSTLVDGVVKAYFIIAVLLGGILGLSLANAVFVDEMTADNTHLVEKMVAKLNDEFQAYRLQNTQQQALMLEQIQRDVQALRHTILRNNSENSG